MNKFVRIEVMDLEGFLECYKGREILLSYQNEHILNANVRKNLIALVVDYFVINKIKLGTKDCSVLADKIVNVFPNEEKSNYFIAGSGKKNAKEALYTKYNNRIRFYRCKGLIEATAPKRNKVCVETQPAEPASDALAYSDQDLTCVIDVKKEVCDTDEFHS